jgi:predicted  nucleic acid-binding Zn-ribbon protein
MIEFLNSLEWPAAFAVVASIVTITVGLFGYLRNSKKPTETQSKILTTEEYEKLHTRINDAIERIAENEGDLKEVRASIRSLQHQCTDHEQRDITDFKLIDAKIERLMDIVVRILQDDRL